jgi:diguanylate cyclase (GGDEF)-like protein
MIFSFLDLEEKRIAMQGGFYGIYELRRILNGLGLSYELVETETAEEALEMLHRGEVDACSLEQLPSIKLVRRYDFWRSPLIYAPAQIFYAAVEGKHAELLARLDEKLREWHANPLSPLKSIQHRWFYDEEYTFFPEWVRWSFWIAGGAFLSMLLVLGIFFWKEKTIRHKNGELRQRMEAERFLRETSHELLGKSGEGRSLEEICRKLHHIVAPQGLLLLGSSPAEGERRRTLEVFFEDLPSRDPEKPSFGELLREHPSPLKRLPIPLLKELRSKKVLRCASKDLLFLGDSPSIRDFGASFFSLYPVFEGTHLWGTLILVHPENPLPPEGTDLLMATFGEILSAHLLQRREARRLFRLATTDSLTGLPNRRSFFEALGREISRSRRHGNPLTLILCDIDHFKEVNDTYGHDAGDRVLRQFGQRLRQTLRTEDLPARYGGEEFGVILPETDLPEAVQIAERLRALVEEAPFFGGSEKDALPPIPLTASFGVSRFEGERDHMEALFSRADCMLYQAKGKGRNTVSPSLELFSPGSSV